MPIPSLIFGLLPEGIHRASLSEVRERFSATIERRTLWQGFERFVEWVRSMDVFAEPYLAGGFVTAKEETQDIDVVLKFSDGPNFEKFDPRICDKEYVKNEYGIDVTMLTPPPTKNVNCKPAGGFAASLSLQAKLQKGERKRVADELKRVQEAEGTYDYRTFPGQINSYHKGMVIVSDWSQ